MDTFLANLHSKVTTAYHAQGTPLGSAENSTPPSIDEKFPQEFTFPSSRQPAPEFRHRALALTAAILGYTLFAYDNTVIANVRPRIVQDLGNTADLPLLSVAYNLAIFSANLFWGQLYRSFDAKWLFCAAVLVFEMGTAVCGAAPSIGALVGGRVIAGLGGGGIYLGTMTFVTAMTSGGERPKWLALVGVGYAAGLIAGPVIAGAFAASDPTWRWSFYLLLPIGAVLAAAYLFLLPSLHPPDGERGGSRLRRIDYLGFLFFTTAVVGFNLFPAFGGSEYSWSSPQVVGLAVCFAIVVVAFAAQQYFCLLTSRTNRCFPGHLLGWWEMCLQWAAMCMVMLSMYVPLYTIPLHLHGVKLVPYVGTMVVALLASGGLMRKHPFYMAYFLVGGLLIVAGGVLLHFATLKRGDGYLLGVSVLVSAGCGICGQTAFSVAQCKVKKSEDIPAATTFIGTAQVGGVSIGLVTSNSIFVNLATNRLVDIFPDSPRNEVVNAVTGADSLLLETLAPAARRHALELVKSAVQDVYWLVVGSGVVLVVLALCMKRERLS
ncbi:uncharacterized protein LTR77_011038 [Saxophila tyrrhenica]|uniref:Major facilitator superfamily (MFS) profile domain-containing protein n=1 Tax=Saxophila tyrrhenica TaxID=1690608 RepID=A0AAV9NWC6_9PEZI|nr:hypothetical protein LTR77_011038 [Saxophila tyrrhenica]